MEDRIMEVAGVLAGCMVSLLIAGILTSLVAYKTRKSK